MENINTESPYDTTVEESMETVETQSQSSKPALGKRKARIRSEAWNHFVKTECGVRAVCNYCHEDVGCHPTTHGTGAMRNHMNRCKKFPGRREKEDSNQTLLASKIDDGEIAIVAFTKEKGRKALAEYLVGAELPFRHVENRFFKKFCAIVQPRLTLVSRVTIARDIFQTYLSEKEKMKGILGKYRVSLTTDTWRSIQNLNYMCVTAHFIDDNWVLHKRIINFFIVPNHKGDTIGRELESCIREWGITKLVSVTVDNASSNNTALDYLKAKVKKMKGCIIFHPDQLQLRCCAHIVNLIVTDGLKEIDESVEMIRNSVRYVRSSTTREKQFNDCVAEAGIGGKARMSLDVLTRWNSTYTMLRKAVKYKSAFDLMKGDGNYDNYFGEKENGKEVKGPPEDNHWEKAKEYVIFLETFYEVTLKFSGTKYATANLFFHEIFEVRQKLMALSRASSVVLQSMAQSMIAKFEKYWGTVDKMNDVLIVAAVLDPRYKMVLIRICFDTVYDDLALTETVCQRVSKMLHDLVKLYDESNPASSNKHQQDHEQHQDPNFDGPTDSITSKLLNIETFDDHNASRNEVDVYLSEARERVRANSQFDVLSWWKVNSNKYPLLSSIARDVLAAQVSTVASESAFSAGGRVLDKYRSSMHPRMAEALMCLRDWYIGDDASVVDEFCKEAEEELESSESIVNAEMMALSINSASASCSVSNSR